MRALRVDKLTTRMDDISEDNSQLGLWVEVFKLQYVTRRFAPTSSLGPEHPSFEKTWKEACHGRLTHSEHAKLREKLLLLEDTHGDVIHKRLPPRIGPP